MNTTANNINNTTSNAKNTTSSHAGSLGNTSNININVSNLANTSNKNITNPGMDTSPNKNLLNPFVYVTTSNMNKQKLNKLFDFPIITPLIVTLFLFREENNSIILTLSLINAALTKIQIARSAYKKYRNSYCLNFSKKQNKSNNY